MSDALPLTERVRDVRSWARARISHCERVESEAHTATKEYLDSRAERRALETVLHILDGTL